MLRVCCNYQLYTFVIKNLPINILVFKVDEAASMDTLKSISEWFKTGHNVAVCSSGLLIELVFLYFFILFL